MRFHVPGLPHTVTNKQYCHCAFTQKVYKLCEMLTSLGHDVFHYGCEGSNPVCTEHIDVITDEFRKKFYPDEWHEKQWDYNVLDECHKAFFAKTIEESRKRLGKQDFFLCSWGWGHQPMAAKLSDSMIIVEPGIGYKDTFCSFRVFESYNWMSHVYGRGKIDAKTKKRVSQEDGTFFDAVIPNYFDPKDFDYTPDEKEDYFLFLGRVVRRKGIHVAMDVMTRIGGHLKIAGQGELKIPPRQGGEIIEYLGFADMKTRRKLLSRAKAVIMPTIYIEPFGGVAIEAMMCVPRGQDILSNDSIKKFEDLKNGDTVDTLSGSGIVIDTFKQHYDGKIVIIKCANSLPFATTPNHPILVANLIKTYDKNFRRDGKFPYIRSISGANWIPSSNIQVGDFLVIPKLKTNQEISTVDISQYIQKQTQPRHKRIMSLPVNHDMMQLFGLYVSEGCVGGHVSLSFGSHEHHLIKTAKRIIESNTPYAAGEHHGPNNCTTITFGGAVLHRFFADQFGHLAHKKKIPSWILNAPVDLLKSFLLGYIEGDGCHTGECLSCVTSSKALALQLQKAFSKFDILVSITHEKRGGQKGKIRNRIFNMRDRYLVRSKIKSIFNENVLDKKKESKLYLQDADNFYVRVNSIIWDRYNDEVFNISTTDGTFSLSNIVSHNSGTPVISTDWGVFPETVLHGITGYRCRTLEQFEWACYNIDNISPEICRKWAMDNFTMDRVATMYQEYFEMLLYTREKEGWYKRNSSRKEMKWLDKKFPTVTPTSDVIENPSSSTEIVIQPEENEPKYALDLSWYAKPKESGISFLMRAKNEERTIGMALDSLAQLSIPYEVNLVLNNCTDETEKKVKQRIDNGQRINLYHYPFQLGKTGLENQCTPVTSVHSTIWLLNWMLFKGNFKYTFRWDADFIMTSALSLDINKRVIQDNEADIYNVSALFSDSGKSNQEPYLWSNFLRPRYCRYSLWHLTKFGISSSRVASLQGSIIHDSPLSVVKEYWETEPWWNLENREETKDMVQKCKEKYQNLLKIVGDCSTRGRASCPESEELAKKIQQSLGGADIEEIPALKFNI